MDHVLYNEKFSIKNPLSGMRVTEKENHISYLLFSQNLPV